MNAVLKLGNAVLGEWRSGAAPHRPAMPAAERQVRQRRNELSRLAHLRLTHDLALGEGTAWAILLANTIAALGEQVTGEAICTMAASFRLPAQNLRSASAIARDAETARRLWGAGRYPLVDGETVAELLEVTAAEREEACLKAIGSCDETAAERRRRLDREAKSAKRAARAAEAGPRLTQSELALLAGVSLSTWQRRNRDLKSVGSPSRKKNAQARDTRARVKKPTPNRSGSGRHG